MRILIIAPRFTARPNEYYEFPLGLACISAVLKAHGREVRCLNLNHREGPVAEVVALEARQADVVMTGGLSVHYGLVREIVGAARAANPGAVTVAGGGLVSSEPRLMLAALGVDYGVVGEGEATVVELVQALEEDRDPSQVAGLVLAGPSGEPVLTPERPPILDLDSLPPPDYEGFDADSYLAVQRQSDTYYHYPFPRPRLLPVISSRSCPFGCTFCYHPLGKRYRKRSLASFFAELDTLADRYGINGLVILDELFSLDRTRLNEFVERIAPMKLKFIAQLRVDGVDEETLRRLKRAGLYCISYGLESADDSILKSMRKQITTAQIETALEATWRAGIGIQGNFLFGDPAETMATARATLDWWQRHSRYHISLTWVIPYPGSPVYGHCLEQGLIHDRLAFIEAGCQGLNMTAMRQEEVAAIGAEISRLTAENRVFGDIRHMHALGPDPVKGGQAYDFTVRCPHCGHHSRYRNYLMDRLEYFTLACRCCNQRYDLSPAGFSHVRQAALRLRERLEAARAQGRPLAVVPTLFPHTFKGFMDLLGLNPLELDIDCFLDDRPQRVGPGYLGRYDVWPLDRPTVAGRASGHAVLLLPVHDRERLRGLLLDYGVRPADLMTLDLSDDPEQGSRP